MEDKIKRRDFLARTCRTCIAGCALLASGNALAVNSLLGQDDEIPDPEKLNYCGYTCPEKCDFLVATLEDDEEKKKECFEGWAIKERYGIDYDPEIAFCYGCKTKDKPEGVVVSACTVRKCAQKKGLDCCIECEELTSCDKELWVRFEEFYESVKKMQVKYQAAQG